MDPLLVGLLFPLCTACLGWFVYHWFSEVNSSIRELTEAVRKRVHIGDFKESLNRVHMRVDEVDEIQRSMSTRLGDVERRISGLEKQ